MEVDILHNNHTRTIRSDHHIGLTLHMYVVTLASHAFWTFDDLCRPLPLSNTGLAQCTIAIGSN